MILKENSNFIFDKPREINIKFIVKYLFAEIERVLYSLVSRTFHPSVIENKKYNTVICAIFKNEASYFKEWIEFHRIIGIEHFYLYNNCSTDNYMEILKEYIDKGIVDLIEWPMQQAQLEAYTDCVNKYKNDSKWIGFIDIDEFVVPIEDDNIYDFLKKYENKFPAIVIYWKLFGSSGKISRDLSSLVTEQFTQCWKKYDEVGKCFYNTAYDFAPNEKKCHVFHHFLWAKYKGILLPPANCMGKICVKQYINRCNTNEFPIQINHYFTKSYDEYTTKKSKGDVFYKNNPHESDDYFYKHDKLSISVDYNIFKYIIKLKKMMDFDV
ncbi:MAG: glycosyltransferase family 92 protein [Lachnospiraceae bacterium]|nr:glycosyltransferase family 92 protein [Lachnospiraceae bacterium]